MNVPNIWIETEEKPNIVSVPAYQFEISPTTEIRSLVSGLLSKFFVLTLLYSISTCSMTLPSVTQTHILVLRRI